MSATFKCAQCEGTFDKEWTDEEAITEYAENFGTTDLSDAAQVCDDCYQQIMAVVPSQDLLEHWANPPLRKATHVVSLTGEILYKVPGESDSDHDAAARKWVRNMWQKMNDDFDLSMRARSGDAEAIAEIEQRDIFAAQCKAEAIFKAAAAWAETPRMTLEAMVRGLAASDVTDSESGHCVLCGGWDDRDPLLLHSPTCEYLHAVAWCEEQDNPAVEVEVPFDAADYDRLVKKYRSDGEDQ